MSLSVSYKEKDLTENFCNIIENEDAPWGELQLSFEFTHRSGRTDIIAIDSNETIYAFEMKLEKWKNALNQAFRNTSFANKSFVVLPKKTAMKALNFHSEFIDSKVGLCEIDGANLTILIDAEFQNPLFPWLNLKAIKNIKQKK